MKWLLFIAVLLIIGIASAAPSASFTKNVSSGAAPLTVQFNDTSTGTLTSWTWVWGELKYTEDYETYIKWSTYTTNSANRNATHTFSAPGLYLVNLTVTGGGTSTSATQNITVTGISAASERAPANSLYRKNVTSLPVHTSNATWVSNTFNDENDYWVRLDVQRPYNIVTNFTATQYLTYIEVPSTSDNISYPIPNPALQDPYLNSPDYWSDKGLIIYNKDSHYYYDFYVAEQASNGTWSASRANAYDMMNNTIDPTRTRIYTGILPFTYDEVQAGTIDHMLQATVSQSGAHVWPWLDDGNLVTGYAPLGAVFRLKSTVDVNTLAATCDPACPTTHVVMHALQNYGAIITDMHGTEGVVLIKGTADDTRMGNMWADDPWAISMLIDPNTDFEFVNTTDLMISDSSLEIYITPVAQFSANNTYGTSPLSVGFTDISENTPTAWKWYWYANETLSSSSQHPETTFTTGTYDVRLNASNYAGYDWENKTVYINVTAGGSPPIASFTKNHAIVLLPQSIIFTDTSLGTYLSWNWSFGDGSTNVTTQNATHKYTRPGIFTVYLLVENLFGNSTNTTTVGVVRPSYELTPFNYHYVSCEDLTYSLSRDITSPERLMTDEKIIGLCALWV